MPALDLTAEKAFLARMLREGGAVAMRYFGRSPKVEYKGNNSPVTEADYAVDAHIAEAIAKTYPGDGYLSEEREDDGSRGRQKRFWVLDPIDGTRGFMAGGDDWCVSLALYQDGEALIGGLYQPSTDRLILAAKGGGVSVNGEARAIPPEKANPINDFCAPPLDKSRDKALCAMLKGCKRISCRSLALKVAALALGEVDLVVSERACHLWDVAAALLILEEMDGIVSATGGESPYQIGMIRIRPFLGFRSQAVRDAMKPVLAG